MNVLESGSTRPYLIRALYEWCTDNGLTPYVAVRVDEAVQVPREYVKDGEIVLNISYDATSALQIGNDFLEFKARFAGTPREIMVPISRILAIYARENGQGMAFPMIAPGSLLVPAAEPASPAPDASSAGEPAQQSARVVQLVTPEEDTTSAPPEHEPEPPRPSGGNAPRPSLKRVK